VSGYVALRLPRPGAVVTWFVTGTRSSKISSLWNAGLLVPTEPGDRQGPCCHDRCNRRWSNDIDRDGSGDRRPVIGYRRCARTRRARTDRRPAVDPPGPARGPGQVAAMGLPPDLQFNTKG
jgi:hypothetical protein